MTLLAIIPARGGSKRLPRKNVQPFAGVPLILWSVRFARSMPEFDRIVVSTDDEEIADICRADGQEVGFLRDAALSGDTASSVDLVLDVLSRETKAGRAFDMVGLLQPTSPVRYRDRWVEAIAAVSAHADAAIGVARAAQHPFQMFSTSTDGYLVPREGTEKLKLRSQDLPPVYSVIGNLYVVRSRAFVEYRSFFPERTVAITCDRPAEGVDIDEVEDWVAAEALVRHLGITT